MALALPTLANLQNRSINYIPLGTARETTARRISGLMKGGNGLRESFVGFVTVHTHIEPAGITSLRTMEKASPSIDVSATRRCWPGLTLKSMLTSAEGTVALVTPSTEKIIANARH